MNESSTMRLLRKEIFSKVVDREFALLGVDSTKEESVSSG